VFVDTPVKRFIAGDDSALSGDAKLGALLFYGEAGCGGCHSGNFFTDEAFHVVSMPQVGRGKGNNGVNGNDDFGRFRESGVEADRYAFRTPSLINTAVTGPWGHAGT
jgi:cytochrome c peroxidase